MRMTRSSMAILPLALLAACSKPQTPATAVVPATAPAQTATAEPVAQAAAALPPPAPAANPEPVEPPPAAPPVAAPSFVIPRGARLRVRLDQTLDTRRTRAGDHFSATL